MTQAPLIPRDWRRRREAPSRSARFEVSGSRGQWDLIDWAYATVINFDRKADALAFATFARAYVKRHGDIDLRSMPYTLDDPLGYDDPEDVELWWAEEYP